MKDLDRALENLHDPALRASMEALADLVRRGLLPEHAFWSAYEKAVSTAPAASASPPLEDLDVAVLPTFLALAVDHWARETHPVQRLWRLCDAVELLVRYVGTVAVAGQVLRAGGRLPPTLAQRLAGRMERPTFGVWLDLANAALEEGGSDGLLGQVRRGFFDCIAPYVGQGRDHAETHLLPLRNLLAHGGGMTRAAAWRLAEGPEGHERRGRDLFLFQREWLASGRVVFVDGEGGCVLLQGLRPTKLPARDVAGNLEEHAGHVVWLGDDGQLRTLWPLFGYGLSEVVRAGRRALRGIEPAPQVYVRAEPASLLYNALGGDLPFCERSGDALECFRRLFVVARPQPEGVRAGRIPDFTDELEAAAEERVGREAELQLLVEAVASKDRGILWVSGAAGMGKSVLMASVACHKKVAGDPRKRLVVAHRFKSGDARCSREAFLRQAVDRLQRWDPLARPGDGGESKLAEEPVDAATAEPVALIRRFRHLLERVATLAPPSDHERSRAPQVLFVLDGLDEVARVDPHLPTLPFEHAFPNVLWLCAGRPEPALVERFVERGPATVLFPPTADHPEGGLPPMGRADIRAMLLNGAEHERYLLLERERASDGASNDFVEAVVARSAGLPLYVRLVLEDLVRRQVRPDAGLELPESLEAYFEDLLGRYGIDDLHQVLTPLVATLAVAAEPLDEPTMHALLAHRRTVEPDGAGLALVRRALQTAGAVLRLAPTPQGTLGYTLYHETFRIHVGQVSGETRQAAATARRALADAAADWATDALTAARGYLLRRGVMHLLEMGRSETAAELLTDVDFAEGVVLAADASSLAQAYRDTAASLDRSHSRRRVLELLGEAVRMDGTFLARNPELLFQTLWNRCWWYDAPQAAEHYVEPEGGWIEPPPWEGPGEKLHALMDRWRARNERGPGRVWLRSLRPPQDHLGSALLAVLRGHEGYVSIVAFGPDGRRLVSGSWDGTMRLWDADSGAELRVLRGHDETVQSVAFSPDGRCLWARCAQTVRLWDAETGAELRTVREYTDQEAVAFSPDGRRLLSGSIDGSVRLWDADSGAELRVLRGHKDRVEAVAFSPDGRRLLSGSGDETVRLWGVESGAILRVFRGHEGGVRSMAFSPDGLRLFTLSGDGLMRLWNARSGAALQASRDSSKPRSRLNARGGGAQWYTDTVNSAVFSPNGRILLFGSSDKTVRLWDAVSGAELRVFRGHGGNVTSVAFSPDSRRLLSGSWDGTVRLWDADYGGEPRASRGHGGVVTSAAFSPDGRRVLSGSCDETIRLWDAESGVERRVLRGDGGRVNSVAFSPDGHLLLSGDDEGSMSLWDADCGERRVLRVLDHIRGVRSGCNGYCEWCGDYRRARCWQEVEIFSVAFSPDGRALLSGSHDRTVRLWNTESGAELRVLYGHKELVTSVAFSPDGRRLLSGSWDRTVRMWDAEGGAELLVLRGHTDMVLSVAFSSDGRRILSGSSDKTVRLWDAESGECVEVLNGQASVRNLALTSPGTHPWIPLVQAAETLVLQRPGREVIARMPLPLEDVQTSPANPRLILGATNNYLALFVLEGVVLPKPPPE